MKVENLQFSQYLEASQSQGNYWLLKSNIIQKLGEIWMYQGVTAGYSMIYFYIPKYETIISIAASIGSIKDNPIQFSSFTKQVIQIILNK